MHLIAYELLACEAFVCCTQHTQRETGSKSQSQRREGAREREEGEHSMQIILIRLGDLCNESEPRPVPVAPEVAQAKAGRLVPPAGILLL
jgi:hypothetical protein